jgi:hypothetical protein
VAGIVVGAIAGLARKRALPAAREQFCQAALGAITTYCGLRMAWLALESPPWPFLKRLALVVVSLAAGKAAGRLMRLQEASNRLGQVARSRISGQSGPRGKLADGFMVCSILFCAAPLGWLGAVQDGLSGDFYPLLIKGVMDGLATMGFATLFGSGVLLSAIPVMVMQGGISLLGETVLRPFLERHDLIDPVNAVSGLLIFCVAMIIFDLKKIRVADYLPSLIIAPLLAWWLG